MAGRVVAIGDIHGCAAELERLLAAVAPAPGDVVVCVGDYIDRGPDSRQVIDRLLDLRGENGVTTVFLKGNHEDMCLSYLGFPGHWGEAWRANGADAMLASYGIHPDAPPGEIRAALPAAHLEFLSGLQPLHLVPGHLLVHAGIHPARPLADQDEEDLFWIREDFILRPHPLPETVVFGHTPYRQVLADLPYKIGIDTGCVYGGMLTALELRERVLLQVRRGSHSVETSALPQASGVRG